LQQHGVFGSTLLAGSFARLDMDHAERRRGADRSCAAPAGVSLVCEGGVQAAGAR
jgi:hypothetical protein